MWGSTAIRSDSGRFGANLAGVCRGQFPFCTSVCRFAVLIWGRLRGSNGLTAGGVMRRPAGGEMGAADANPTAARKLPFRLGICFANSAGACREVGIASAWRCFGNPTEMRIPRRGFFPIRSRAGSARERIVFRFQPGPFSVSLPRNTITFRHGLENTRQMRALPESERHQLSMD